MKMLIPLWLGCALLLVGCMHITPSVQQPTEEPMPTGGVTDPLSDRSEVSMDSPGSGVFQDTVFVKQKAVLDPWTFAGEENADQRSQDCMQRIASGEVSSECPTDIVLYLVRANGDPFPSQINRTQFNKFEGGINELTIGCLTDEGRYAEPVWVLERGDPTSIVSENDQQQLLTALETEQPIEVRIEKQAYDILGRGGTSCDVFFHQLKVVE